MWVGAASNHCLAKLLAFLNGRLWIKLAQYLNLGIDCSAVFNAKIILCAIFRACGVKRLILDFMLVGLV